VITLKTRSTDIKVALSFTNCSPVSKTLSGKWLEIMFNLDIIINFGEKQSSKITDVVVPDGVPCNFLSLYNLLPLLLTGLGDSHSTVMGMNPDLVSNPGKPQLLGPLI